MRKLHMHFYLAILGTLAAFLVAGAMIWHHFSSPQSAVAGVESATAFAGRLLDDAPAAQRRNEIVDALALQVRADVALYDARGTLLSQRGSPLLLAADEIRRAGWLLDDGGPAYIRLLRGGEHLVVRPRHHFLRHGLHMGLMLTGIALTLALLTYPITRGITARLARLQEGVRQFGAGILSARVRVEGRDEVAMLARSFNDSAERIEQLVRAHQMLLANCSHELRTPLARIRLTIERLSAADQQVSAELVRNVIELDTLIGEMLLASRLDGGRGLERTEPLDLLVLVAEEAAHFDLEVSGVSVTLIADAVLMRRLVRNLLENARVHGGGATDIRIERDERHVRIIVEDAGPGVSEVNRDKIFEPFFRAGATSQPRGAGLGLSIVKQIARAHGGAVGYLPRPGGGSRFIVTVPRAPE